MSSLDLSPAAANGDDKPRIRRLNKLPVVFFIGLVVLFFGVVIWGLSIRGLNPSGGAIDTSTGAPATNFADQLKRGISDGVIEEPRSGQRIEVAQPVEKTVKEQQPTNPFQRQPTTHQQHQTTPVEGEVDWRERLQREQDEQTLRLLHQQRMAQLQAEDAAYDSPIAVNIGSVGQAPQAGAPQATTGQEAPGARPGTAADLYAAALRVGGAGQGTGSNDQAGKIDFFNQDTADLGYLPNRVVPQQSAFELKRGSVIPATLVTGINSDLPGHITAQVSQNVYDSATGHRLLVPQGAKLLGRYDSNVSFGQRRVLVIWTDLIFPNGSTLQIGGMAGVDADG